MWRQFFAIAVLSVFINFPVNAAVSSSATLSNITFTLVDLNLSDGIPASLSFSSNLASFETSNLLIRTYVYNQTTGNTIDEHYQNKFGTGTFPFDSDSVSVSYVGGNVYSSITEGAGPLGAHTLSTGGEAAPAPNTNTTYTTSALAPVNRGTQFLLSPHTLLILTGTANFHAAATIGLDVPTGRVEEAGASALLSLRGVGSSGNATSTQISNDLVGLSASYTQDLVATDPITGVSTYQITPQNLTLTRQLSVSFLNNSSEIIGGVARTEVHSSGYSSLSPVPEPGSATLLAGGLLVSLMALYTRARNPG